MSSDDSKLAEYTGEEVAQHNDKKDPWLAIGGRVYAVKDYMASHPGGAEVLYKSAGKEDSTDDFQQIGHGANAREVMKKYAVGKVAGAELMSDEDLAGAKGEGSKWLIFAILAVVMAYFYMSKMKKAEQVA